MEEVREKIVGVVEHITYYNGDNGYTVMDVDSDGVLVTAVGSMPCLAEGDTVIMQGQWVFNSKYGRQFKVESLEQSLPQTTEDVLRYLSSGAVKGVGAKTAIKIVEKFGDDTLYVLENDYEKLTAIKGISLDKARKISDSYKSLFGVREIVMKLQKYGINNNQALKIYKKLGSNAVKVIEKNPYLLCECNLSIGFEKADEIAAQIGDTPRRDRIAAGIRHVLRHNTYNGHTCLPREKLLKTVTAFLEEEYDNCDATLENCIEDKIFICREFDDNEFIFLPSIFNFEETAARRLSLKAKMSENNNADISSEIKRIEKNEKIEYHELQKKAISYAVNKGVLVLTGGPGTGKTTTLKGIISLLLDRDEKIMLAAPTGRAAKRMEEVCGLEAKTVHRLLEVNWTENDEAVFQRNHDNMLECDTLIVDEMSMVDIRLFEGLIDALPLSSRLIMVGDSDQLPSVGPGAVLADIIKSGRVPVVELNTVFRQAEKSLIVTNAHKIVRGEYPQLDVKDNDFFFLNSNGSRNTVKTVADLYCTRLPKSYSCDPVTDIQILCPSRMREEGSVAINQLIQQILNPPSPEKREISIAPFILREGDKVMQIKNDYDIPYVCDNGEEGCGIYNGDIGRLISVDTNNQIFKIKFDDKEALYNIETIRNVELSYAVTVHKSQGSEYDNVIIPLYFVSDKLCYRNLLYTAVTRAKSRLIIVGQKETLYAMVDNDREILRYTALEKLMI